MAKKTLYLRRKGYVGSAIIERLHVTVPSPAYKGKPEA